MPQDIHNEPKLNISINDEQQVINKWMDTIFFFFN